MIIDSIIGLERYRNINAGFEKAFKFLRSNDLSNLALGKHEIDGENVFAKVSECDLKEVENAKLEVHDSYIDIQIPLSTNEIFGWKDRTACNAEKTKYDEIKDIAFFDDEPESFITLEPNQLVIFFPHDAHAPLIGKGKIKKIIIKVHI